MKKFIAVLVCAAIVCTPFRTSEIEAKAISHNVLIDINGEAWAVVEQKLEVGKVYTIVYDGDALISIKE